MIGTGYFISYGIGHLINGFLADRISPIMMLIIGMCGTAAANTTMIFVTPSFPLMVVVWCLNGFAKYGRSSTVSKIYNSLIYIGTAVLIYIFGAVAEYVGWTVTVILWLFLAVIPAAILMFAVKLWGKFIKEDKTI